MRWYDLAKQADFVSWDQEKLREKNNQKRVPVEPPAAEQKPKKKKKKR